MENRSTSCDIYEHWRKGSKGFLVPGYSGIPQNLILNVIGCVIMVVIFSIMRKKAWNYGRIALVQRNEVRWTDMFYGATADPQIAQANQSLVREGSFQQGLHLQPNENPIADRGIFNWISTTINLTEQQFLAKCGPDAVQYLSYERHLIFLVFLLTSTSLLIELPINFQGTAERKPGSPTESDFSEFKQSTIVNLGHQASLLWVHILISIVYLFLTVIVMRHFSRPLKLIEDEAALCHTVTITGIAKKSCQEEKLRQHFEDLYPGIIIDEISFAYDISRLQSNELNKESAISARKYWEKYMRSHGKRPKMRPFTCGNICCCWCLCGVKSVDAIDYYYDQESKYRREVEKERKRSLTRPLGIAFITFQTIKMAEKIIYDHRLTTRYLTQVPVSRYSRKLKTYKWVVRMAPPPEDIYWENLALGFKAFYFKALLVNATLLVVITFYTTPVVLLAALNTYLEINNANQESSGAPANLGGLLSDTIPTILLWVSAVTLPSIVSLSDRIIGFWTKTAENRSRMIKTFTFLLFMVVILPSLGLTSLSAAIGKKELNWNCIFHASNASFFVNYVVTSTFLGTASELMRLPDLIVYAFRLCFAKSSGESTAIRDSSLWEFQLGSQYAWLVLIFAITVIFSSICPVITPVGLLYLVLKYFVDRYNIYFAYAPCKVNKDVHGTAINFVIVVMFLLQIILLVYTNSGFDERDANKPLQLISIFGFIIAAAIFICQVFFNMCANFSSVLDETPDNESTDSSEGTSSSEHEFSVIEPPPSNIVESESHISEALAPVHIQVEEDLSADSIPPGFPGVEFSHIRRNKMRDRTVGKYYPAILRKDHGKERKSVSSDQPATEHADLTEVEEVTEVSNNSTTANQGTVPLPNVPTIRVTTFSDQNTQGRSGQADVTKQSKNG